MPDSKNFKALVKVLNDIVSDEVAFKVDDEGIHLLQMDPSHIAMTELNMPKHCFEEFICETPGTFVISVERLFKRVLKHVNKNETVTFDLVDGKAHITLKARLKRLFTLPLLEPSEDNEEPPKPKLTHDVLVKLVTGAVKDILQDVENIHLKITTDQEKITFEKLLDDLSEAYSVTLKRGCDSLLDIEKKSADPVKAHYSLTYLKGYVEAVTPLSEILTLCYATDMPICASVNTPEGYLLTFWLAPRIIAED